MLSTGVRINSFIETNNIIVKMKEKEVNYLEEMISYLKYFDERKLGHIPVIDLIKRFEYEMKILEENKNASNR